MTPLLKYDVGEITILPGGKGFEYLPGGLVRQAVVICKSITDLPNDGTFYHKCLFLFSGSKKFGEKSVQLRDGRLSAPEFYKRMFKSCSS